MRFLQRRDYLKSFVKLKVIDSLHMAASLDRLSAPMSTNCTGQSLIWAKCEQNGGYNF